MPGNSEKFNRAYTLKSLGKRNPSALSLVDVWRVGVFVRDNGCSWVWRQGNRVAGMISARPRSGPQSWEITHLFLSTAREATFADLLEKASYSAASHGGERIFLRLQREDPLVDIARHSGFFPCIPETLYKRDAPPSPASNSSLLRLREKSDSDNYALFRLYSAATPSEVRYTVGMSFDQFMASREPGQRGCQELLLDHNGSVGGTLRIMKRSQVGQLVITIHPATENCLPSILDIGLSQLSKLESIHCLVPEYQIALQRALSDKGFQPEADYITLVKSMTVKVKQDVRVGAAASM